MVAILSRPQSVKGLGLLRKIHGNIHVCFQSFSNMPSDWLLLTFSIYSNQSECMLDMESYFTS